MTEKTANGEYAWLLEDHGTAGDARTLFQIANRLAAAGDDRLAATAFDRAFAVDPDDEEIALARAVHLDGLAVEDHGLRFCYVPAGTFLMGSMDGEPDERPVRPVRLGDYWLSETAVSWATFCDVLGWEPAPVSTPPQELERKDAFMLHQGNKIRRQYCEDGTRRARDWHAHAPDARYTSGAGGPTLSAVSLFGSPDRGGSQRPWTYDGKPMVSVAWDQAAAMCAAMSTGAVQYRLPTEAEWEHAARGGFSGRRRPWGDEPPTPELCDFDRFDAFAIRPMRALPPNGYGLFGMAGSVWEWTADWYDAEYYQHGPADNPRGPESGEHRVLRGGSWADCADVQTVSFRMSRSPDMSRSTPGHTRGMRSYMAANIGFRICRTAAV
ncbi:MULTISPECIES: formylglycine-generating enzyme family protein [Pseudofrankia]|uniref:formylglycine-generating enzyme family protein n=1 Tax=Pseudofrankia TaxID=2994363 RepID=UPI000234C2B3|nr:MULTISPECIES: SUMF1/EgtB/PvdO family nonheme iron enzyme [Pseudofrankia]